MKKSILKSISLVAFAAMFAFVSCDKPEPSPIPDDDDETVEIELDKTAVEIAAGANVSLNILKGNGDYSVSVKNQQVATASVSGSKVNVVAVAAGETEATVSDKAGKSATFSISVTELAAEPVKLVLEDNEITLMVGESGALLITSGNGGYTASSSDEAVATASIEGNGVIILGVGAGDAVITVTDAAEKSAKIYATIKQEVDKTPYGINFGEGHGWGDVGSHIILRCPIVRTYSEEYDFSKLSAVTMECLVKINENPVYWYDDNGGNWLNSIMGSPDYFWLRINNPTTDQDDYPSDYRFNAVVDGVELNSAAMLYGTWYHVALTFKNGEINLYVNGELAETGAANVSYIDLTKTNAPTKWEDQEAGVYNKYYDFFLGCWNQSRWLNGCMSEARLWSVARSPEQLAANATFLDVDDEEAAYGLLAYWKLRGEYDPEIGDYSEICKDYSENHFDLEELSGNPPTETMIKVPFGEYAEE